MNKAVIGITAFMFTAAAFFVFGPLASGWFPLADQEEGQDLVPEGTVTLELLGDITIKQGESKAEAFEVVNMTGETVSYSLGHAQTHLSLEPESALIEPGSSNIVSLHIGDLFQPGSTEMMVYLLAEVEGESFGMETYYISLDVIPGELQLQTENGRLQAYWKGEPAPPGVIVSYREPGGEGETWSAWGETPDLSPPARLSPGYHVFEFIALHGEVESAVETLEVYIEEDIVAEEEAEDTEEAAEEEEPAPERDESADVTDDEAEPSEEQRREGPYIDHSVTVQNEQEDSHYEPPEVFTPSQPGEGSRQWWEP